jgi:hypothetical protein
MTTFIATVHDPRIRIAAQAKIKATRVGKAYYVHHPVSSDRNYESSDWLVSHACGEIVSPAFATRILAVEYARKMAAIYDEPLRPDFPTYLAMKELYTLCS